MRNVVIAFAIIVLLSFSFAQSFSNPIPMAGTLDVTFVDVNGKPIAGAIVDYTYVVSGTGYTADTPTTGTGTTDANGRFTATITADARQTIPFKINLTYQGTQVLHDESSSWLTYADKPATITVNVGALTIEVKDPKGAPIQGVALEISGGRGGGQSAVTNEMGEYAIGGAEAGATYTVVARYGNSEVSRSMEAPAKMELTMPAYDVTVRSVDDRGNRLEAGLSANITALNRKVSGSGELLLKQVPMGDVYVAARYGKALVEKKIRVSQDVQESIIIDLNAPAIVSVVIEPAQPEEREVGVRASVDDGANGVGVASAVLKYAVDNGAEKSVAMGREGGAYAAQIPRQPAGSVVSYYVEVADRNGNSAQSDPASYIVKSGGGGGGGTGGIESGGGFGGLLPILGAVGVVAVLAFIFWKRRQSRGPPLMQI